MFGMQDKFDEATSEYFQSHKIGAMALESLIEKHTGIVLTKEQKNLIEKQLRVSSSSISLDFSDEQLRICGFASEDEIRPLIKNAVKEFPEKVSDFCANIDETMESIVNSVSDGMSDAVLESLFENFESMLEDQITIRENISQYVEDVWAYPLNLLQGLIVMLDESIGAFLDKYPELYEQNFAVEVLVRIHAKANQVAKEIHLLLRNGFADGSQARWRTLHELAVISHFISKHGNECAERYLEHDLVEAYKSALQHNEYCERLGLTPYSQDDITSLKADYDNLMQKYGDEFRFDYGWSAKALGIKKPNFRDIELSVELDHHRPLFKSASSNVHANSTGVLWRLGMPGEMNMLLAGPSEVGIDIPARYTVVSLIQISVALLTFNPTMDGIVVTQVMNKYADKVENAFGEVASRLHGEQNA
ncbi:hypothetical protein JG654_17680 [Vibrio cholerae]|uniref:DUF5677 domain-containing protein n=1 Tax=Vibrio cholerae TaxID=666 RepID=UPI0018F0C1F3|nr:DUF5677 domain-containing protein [Vibrio cholerae]EGQ9108636.1 hypothetical protein [Vibrio cholerae]MBJ6958173.1 hypothetical protein [Vibrio cholerae]MBJ6962168.1 hypothetical protein [Vibrio cholerae]MBY4642691.1 DUF5677 domain-containing protein [Vibrio cholerae]MCR9659144.1 DUF5677 domain-containing protein [Vibrio cholerae]